MEPRNNGFIRSRISRILQIFGLSKGDQWSLLRRPLGGNHGRLDHLISHTHLSSLTTNLSNPHESFILVPNTPIRVDSSDSWFQYLLWHRPFLWVLRVLCALIRTCIRAIRAECGEETHSASPSTHRYPFNLGYPWSIDQNKQNFIPNSLDSRIF